MTVVGVHGGNNSTVVVSGSTCSTEGGFNDVNSGTAVTVYDASGTIVATTVLGAGSGRMEQQSAQFPDIYLGICTSPFSVEVPASAFYQVEASHRGRVSVSELEMGDVKLTLGQR